MIFKQKIFLNNKPLILTNSAEKYIQEDPLSSGYLILKGAFPRSFTMAQSHMEKRFSLGAIIEDISIEDLLAGLNEFFPEITAGGGVVQNEDGDVLMIYRRGKWDLPKGKLDDGETIEECAIREVKEETGLKEISIVAPIKKTYHVYARDGQRYLKATHWFQMKASKNATLIPQKEENILQAKWIDPKDLGPRLHCSYEAIKEVLASAGITAED